MDKKIKEPLVAVLLSLVFPGLGHIYAGSLKRGLLFLVATLACVMTTLICFLHPAIKVTIFSFIPVIFKAGISLFSLVDAYYIAQTYNTRLGLKREITFKKKASLITAMAGVALLYILFALFVWNNVLSSFTATPYAMEPTIYAGERMFIDRMSYPQRGDVVVYRHPKYPKKIQFHRIIGFSGESIEIKDHRIFINKTELRDAWALKVRHYNGGKLAKKGMKPVIVPENSFYLLGDNAARSDDSRTWGFLPKSNLIGKAFKIYYPFERSKRIE